MTLQSHISQRFEQLFDGYRKEIENVRNDSSADAIHDVRVVSRRIIETLRVFEGVLDAKAAAPIEKRLKRWMKSTGNVRDVDVILELADGAGEAAPVGLIARWKKKRDSRWTKLLGVVKGGEIWDGEVNPSKLPLQGSPRLRGTSWELSLSADQNASLVLPFLLERYAAIGNQIGSGVTEDGVYHSFRLRTKRIRYTLESFEDRYPRSEIKEVLGTLKDFQQVLGALHDCAVAAAVAQKTSSKRSDLQPEVDRFGAFADSRAASLRAEWHQKWNRFSSPDELHTVTRFLREAAGKRRSSATKAGSIAKQA